MSKHSPLPPSPYADVSQAAIFDNEGNVLTIFEKSYPVKLRRWGFPKGKFEAKESSIETIYREVYEEVGIKLWGIPHIILKAPNVQYPYPDGSARVNHLIFINRPSHEIPIELGDEIMAAFWIPFAALGSSVKKTPCVFNRSLRLFLHSIPRKWVWKGRAIAKKLPQ